MKVKQITALLFCLMLTAIQIHSVAQDSASSAKRVNEAGISDAVKSFWKTNELIIGISIVVLTIIVIFFTWRKKKKGIDSVL